MAVKKKPLKKPLKKAPKKKAVKKKAIKKKRPRGRPGFKVTKKILNKVESLAARGLTTKQIARSLGWGKTTYFAKKHNHPELTEAYKYGKALGIVTVTNSLFTNAKNGDQRAVEYYLNNRDSPRWKAKQTRELTGPGGGPIVVEPKTTINKDMSAEEASRAYASEILSPEE